ncbi:RNA methyltransferase [candidate division KSB1 bacterium]|nr:RNA methyltransferase [candidate division KSB1 bacterium]
MRKLNFDELQAVQVNRGFERIPLIALLDDVRSLHNVGSIFRTADGVGVEKLFLCGITGIPPRPEIRKTSLGAEESVAWDYNKEAMEAVHHLRGRGYQIVALEQTTGSIDYRRADYVFPLCLIVGHEFHGVADELIAVCDLSIDIPMRGIKQSLNVSVAFGVAVYEIASQYRQWIGR